MQIPMLRGFTGSLYLLKLEWFDDLVAGGEGE